MAGRRSLAGATLITLAGLSVAGCGAYIGVGIGVSQATRSGGGSSGAGSASAPQANVTPVTDQSVDIVTVAFRLSDQESSATDVEVQFATATTPGEADYKTATAAVGGTGTRGLATEPGVGIGHTFLWNSARDLDPAGEFPTVRLRVIARESGRSELFAIDETPPFRLGNRPPDITAITPVDAVVSGSVVVTLRVTDTLADPTTIAGYEFSVDAGSTWATMTPAAITGGVKPGDTITASAAGTPVDFTWNTRLEPALAGRVFEDRVSLRLTPADTFAGVATIGSSALSTGLFTIDNNSRPRALSLFEQVADDSGQVSIPFRIEDGDSDPVRLFIQWKLSTDARYPDLSDPALNPFVDPSDPQFISEELADPAVQSAMLADPSTRRRLQLITEAPPMLCGSVGANSTTTEIVAPDLTLRARPEDMTGGRLEVGGDVAFVTSVVSGRLLLDPPLTAAPTPGAPLRLTRPAVQGRAITVTPGGVSERAVWQTSRDLSVGGDRPVQVRLTPFDSRAGIPGESLRSDQILRRRLVSLPGSPLNLTAPRSAAFGDINQDGRVDLIIADGTPGGLSVFLQSASGDFPATADLQIMNGGPPGSPTIADMNSDGRLDIIADQSNGVAVYLQSTSGQPTITPSFTIATGATPSSIAVADFDGNGRADVAVVEGSSVRLYLQDLQGQFAVAAVDPIASGAGSNLAAGDLNGDGRIDLAFHVSSQVTVLTQQAVGAFVSQSVTPPGPGIPILSALALEDFNDDGRTDLVIADKSDSNEVLTLYLQSAQGELLSTQPRILTGGRRPSAVVGGDLNGDGLVDIAAANNQVGTLTLFFQDRRTGIPAAPSLTLDIGADAQSVAIGQNASGQGFVAGVSPSDQTVAVARDGDGRVFDATPNLERQVGTSVRSVTVGDFNGDGQLDIASVEETSDTLSVFFRDPAGALPRSATLTLSIGDRPATVSAGDLDGDGRTDLVAGLQNVGLTRVFLQSSGGLLLNQPDQSLNNPGNGPESSAIGDLNGDGRLDLVMANTGVARVYIQSAAGALPTTPAMDISISVIVGVAIADLDGDGLSDLAIMLRSGSLRPYLQDPISHQLQAPTMPFIAGGDSRALAVGDVNHDGRSDVLVARDSGTIDGYLQSAAVPLADPPAFSLVSDGSPFAMAIGDLNSDGREDIVAANFDTGVLSVFFQRLDNQFNPNADEMLQSGARPLAVAIADLNGDGQNDIVAGNRDGNTLTIYLQK